MAKVYEFLANGFEEIEGLAPVDILRRGGVDIKTASRAVSLWKLPTALPSRLTSSLRTSKTSRMQTCCFSLVVFQAAPTSMSTRECAKLSSPKTRQAKE